MEKISWAYEGYFIVKKLFETEKIRIFAMEGFEHNWDLIHEFEETDYICNDPPVSAQVTRLILVPQTSDSYVLTCQPHRLNGFYFL